MTTELDVVYPIGIKKLHTILLDEATFCVYTLHAITKPNDKYLEHVIQNSKDSNPIN